MSAQLVRFRLNTTDVFAGIENMKAQFPRAVSRAISRTAVAARTTMAKAIAQDTGIPSGTVKAQMQIILANDAAELVITGKRLPLIMFKARGPEPSHGRGRGVSYQLPGSRSSVADAFIATMPTGHRGVFKRRGNARLPIVELFGPSLPHVFAKHLPLGQARAKEALLSNLQSELRFALSR